MFSSTPAHNISQYLATPARKEILDQSINLDSGVLDKLLESVPDTLPAFPSNPFPPPSSPNVNQKKVQTACTTTGSSSSSSGSKESTSAGGKVDAMEDDSIMPSQPDLYDSIPMTSVLSLREERASEEDDSSAEEIASSRCSTPECR